MLINYMEVGGARAGEGVKIVLSLRASLVADLECSSSLLGVALAFRMCSFCLPLSLEACLVLHSR